MEKVFLLMQMVINSWENMSKVFFIMLLVSIKLATGMKANYKICFNMDKELTFKQTAALLKEIGLTEFWKGEGIKNLNKVLKLLPISFKESLMVELKCLNMENYCLMAKHLKAIDMDMVFIILKNILMKANFL